MVELSVRALEKHKELLLGQEVTTPTLILKRVFGKNGETHTLLATIKEGIKDMEAVVKIDHSPVTINRYKNVVKIFKRLSPISMMYLLSTRKISCRITMGTSG